MKRDQSAAGKLVDVVFIIAIAFLLWSQRINEVAGVLLLGAVVQARGAVGVTSRLAGVLGVPPGSSSSGGPPSDPEAGSGGGAGSYRGHGPNDRDGTIQRMATTGSAVGYAGAAWASMVRRPSASASGFVFAVALVLAAGCLAWRF